jgi:hypothetical protein
MDEGPGQVPFRAHVELLRLFLAHREPIVERIQDLLNAQRKPPEYLQDAAQLSRHFEDCFFAVSALSQDQAGLRGQLQRAHWASGFKPRAVPGNDLVEPAQMMIRAFHFWQQTRWPGRNGRIRYAHTLFNLYLIRCLELLVMRLWDADAGGAADRLTQVQDLLDTLWKSAPADQAVLVRDARWLIPLAQSPTTDSLAPYFAVAKQIAASLSANDRLEIQKAGVLMAGGHLRSQLRHYCIKEHVALGEAGLVLTARNTNALDFSITIESLVPLLDAYERAVHGGDRQARLDWASVICQGISSDPELFINRVDLLGAYSMIEYLFVTCEDDGRVAYTPTGLRHVQLLREYAARIARLSTSLLEDIPHFKPLAGGYSPYGVIYGFSSNITEHMAFKSLQTEAVTRFSVEDVFAAGAADTGKLAWVSGWRKLPHVKQEIQKLFEYPQQFAEDIFNRIEKALRSSGAVAKTGRLSIVLSDDARQRPQVTDLPLRYFLTSDPQVVNAGKALAVAEPRLLHDRREGMFLVSYETSGGWVALTKDVLTEVLGAGQDARIVGLPAAAAGVLRLMLPFTDSTEASS